MSERKCDPKALEIVEKHFSQAADINPQELERDIAQALATARTDGERQGLITARLAVAEIEGAGSINAETAFEKVGARLNELIRESIP